ncbi:MAG: aminoglycoside phosphotransferase family protein [Devosia nanyangense]|uniref:Aminoglycoside phosphotransferase family protein n=1 Tax=Devosia nanyangense TaxID=1228055 RepID=A0A933L4R2_9HYPH|nr:aminoglycoside phosphotransferase family protein [Devosia nanyangense]
MTEVSAAQRAAIAAVRPELAAVAMVLHNAGWDCDAIEAGDSIFKFPKRASALPGLRREARLLGLIRPQVRIAVPDMRLHEAPTLFSEHVKIPGQMLETPQYDELTDAQRHAVATKLAEFYADIHAIPRAEAVAAGAEPDPGWAPLERIMELAETKLPPALHDFARRVLAAYAALVPDEPIFGYFDGHGWNMAFDHARGVLNGIYDFADAGTGPRHQDLSYSSFVSPDLTERIIDVYEPLARVAIDRRRVALHTAVQRLAELGGVSRSIEWFIANVVAWHDYMQGRAELRV